MEETVIAPIKEEVKDFEPIEKAIIELLKTEIYLPLLKELSLPEKVLKNASEDDPLVKAIISGQITHDNGSFRGRFNAGVSARLKALGARWDRKQGTWKILLSSLPADILNAIAVSEMKFSATMDRIDRRLRQILPEEIADKLDVHKFFDKALFKTEKKFKKSIEKVTTAPDLTPDQQKKIAQEYTNNMKLFVQNFTQEQIVKLRKDVQSKVFTGQRFEDLATKIQKNFNVTQNKAKFLARQETSLLMAKYKETRYKDAGVKEYIWKCVHMPKDNSPRQHIPGNVRFFHGILDGKRFKFDSPPIVNAKGERKNPGEDFNCRCFARPVVKF